MRARTPVLVAWAALFAALLMPVTARADLQDEIQVYTDDLNEPGEYGLELHVNTTPHGRRDPEYPGEVVPDHGLRVTPEFSYGLSKDWEAGLYLPTASDYQGHYNPAGIKLRMKWIGLHADETTGGYFAGANTELARLAQRYSLSRSRLELKLIGGYRNPEWLLAMNPTFSWDLSDGQRDGNPDFNLGLKIAKSVGGGIALGGEYYADVGKLNEHLPFAAQDHRIYLTVDIDRKPWGFNFGVGRGLNGASDKWTLKAIFEIPLPQKM